MQAVIELLPAAPVYVPGVNPGADASDRELTALMLEAFVAGSVHVPAPYLPPVAGLGGYGIDMGVDLRESPGRLLTGAQWRGTCAALSPGERQAAATAHPSLSVLALLANAAGTPLTTWPPSGAQALLERLVVPVDLCATSFPDGPLAPVDGAGDFDTAAIAALSAWDVAQLRELARHDTDFAADLSQAQRATDLAENAGLEFVVDSVQETVRESHGVKFFRATLTGRWERA